MNNNDCSAYTKETLVDKAKRELHLTKSNAQFLTKEELCSIMNAAKNTKHVLLPSMDLRIEKSKTANLIYFIPRKSPLTYKDYEVLVAQKPKSKVVQIAQKLNIKNYTASNKDTVGIVLSQIKRHLEDKGVDLDPIRIKGPIMKKANNKTNNNAMNVNNRSNNNNSMNVNNRSNNNNSMNVNKANNNAMNVNRANNNMNVNKLKPANNMGVAKVNNSGKKNKLPAIASNGVKIKVGNTINNKKVVRPTNSGSLSINNIQGRVKVGGLKKKSSGITNDSTLVKYMANTYGLTDAQSRLKFLQAVDAISNSVSSLTRLGPSDMNGIKKRLKFAKKKRTDQTYRNDRMN